MPTDSILAQAVTPATLVSFLKRTEGTRLTGMSRLKVVYRPRICPFHELLELIPPGSSVFDIGCGSGTFLRLIAEMRSPTALGGIEISTKNIATTRELLRDYKRSLQLDVYDGVSIPERIAEYDYITLIDVLHHVPAEQQERFLRTLAEKMKPGSRLILKDIDAAQRFLVLFNKLHDFVVSREVGHELAADRVQTLVSLAGLKVTMLQRTRMWFYPHFTLVCQKF